MSSLDPEKAKTFAEAVVAKFSNKDAAMLAGCPEKTATSQGSRLRKHPMVRSEIAKMMEEKGLGKDRVLEELDRGLREGKVGTHSDYLSMALELNGMKAQKKEEAPQGFNVNILIEEAARRGISIETSKAIPTQTVTPQQETTNEDNPRQPQP